MQESGKYAGCSLAGGEVGGESIENWLSLAVLEVLKCSFLRAL